MARAQKPRVRALPTIASSLAPRFFMARAIEPMLPDPRGRTRTMRIFSSINNGAGLTGLNSLNRSNLFCDLFKPCKRFKSFKIGFGPHNRRGSNHFANGHDLFFKITLRFFISNCSRESKFSFMIEFGSFTCSAPKMWPNS